MPAVKYSKYPFGTLSLAGQGIKFILPTIKCSKSAFGTPFPRRSRHQGHIHSFLLVFKTAVCQPSNAPNVPLTPLPLQAKVPRPHPYLFIGVQGYRLPAVKCFKYSFDTLSLEAKAPSSHCQPSNAPNLPLAPLSLAGQGTKATSIAFYWRSRLPFTRLKRSKYPFGTPPLAGQDIKATSIIFYGRSRLPFANRQIFQMFLWHLFPCRPRYQGHIHSFLLVFQITIYQPSNISNIPLVSLTSQAKVSRPHS